MSYPWNPEFLHNDARAVTRHGKNIYKRIKTKKEWMRKPEEISKEESHFLATEASSQTSIKAKL